MGSKNVYVGGASRSSGSTLRAKENPYGLSDKHIRFCYAYCECLSIGEAYQRVYPDANLASSRNAANSLFKRPGIREFIEEIMAKQIAEAEFSLEETLKQMNQILHDKKQPGAVRVAAGDKLLKYFGGYTKHQEAGASKNVYLNMSEEQLALETKNLLLTMYKGSQISGGEKKIEINFEEISYEEVPVIQPSESAEEREHDGGSGDSES